MRTRLAFKVPSDVGAIGESVERVLQRCTACRALPARARFNLRVGLCEALSNAVLYGNGRDPHKRVHLEVEVGRERVSARVTDEGEGFDPGEVPDPTRPENREKEDGRGLFLMRRLMDEVHFNDQGNEVTLVLRLASDEEVPHGAGR